MTNLSKSAREKIGNDYEVGRITHNKVQTSADGTKKYLFPVGQNKSVEAAYIPEKERATLCLVFPGRM